METNSCGGRMKKSKIVEDGKVKGLILVTGFSSSQNLSWMNNLIIVLESEYDPATQKFKNTGHKWE